ncbi:unnamed protein product [Bemisia tabaci]|uniref:Uncharacterized protein n=1 Tax=Bemisia tabaci TaxID=7038 RepID=A0A9P0F1I9_BEMTA|nr:unnamed protein product [Bemisia tabaci]
MKRSRSRSPLNHPPHSKHNWNANAHKWHAGAVAEEECSSDSRNSSRNSHRRSQGDSNCINIPSSHNTERRRRSGSCDTGDHRPRRSGSFDTSEHRLRRISNRWKWEDRKEELRRIRVVIKRNTVHEPDNSPIDRSVNVEEVVIPRHPGEGSHPIFEREDINANETRTVGKALFHLCHLLKLNYSAINTTSQRWFPRTGEMFSGCIVQKISRIISVLGYFPASMMKCSFLPYTQTLTEKYLLKCLARSIF